MGTVVGFHALQGDVKVKPSTNNPELLLELETVRVEYAKGLAPDDAPQFLDVVDCRLERKMLLMRFEGYKDRTEVEHLEGARLFTEQAQLLPLEEEEFWVQDLVGLDVYTVKGEHVGTVASIIGGANDILEIKPAAPQVEGGKMILVPFVKSLVPKVDLSTRRIEVDPIPGLLEAQ